MNLWHGTVVLSREELANHHSDALAHGVEVTICLTGWLNNEPKFPRAGKKFYLVPEERIEEFLETLGE